MSQHKGAKGGLGRTPPKPAPYWARDILFDEPPLPWAARKKAGSPGNRGTL